MIGDDRFVGNPFAPAPFTGWVVPVVLTAGALLTLVPLASTGISSGLIAIGLAVFMVVLLAFSLEVAGSALVVVGMFFAPLTSVVLPGASFVTVTDLLLVIGFLILFPNCITKPLWVPWQFAFGALIFFGVSCFASLSFEVPEASLNLMSRVVAATLIVPLVFLWWAPRGRTLLALAIAYPLGAAFSVCYGLLLGPPSGNARYRGLAEQPTAFGYAALLGVCCLPYVASVLPRERRWIVFPLGAVCCYGIWISGSRASLLVLVVLAAMFPLLERSLKIAGLLAFVGVLVVALFGRIRERSHGSDALSRLLGGGGSQGSNDERIEGLQEAFDRFLLHPIVGNGYDFNSFLAHNVYMQVATCTGIIGLIAFLFVLWAYVIPLFSGAAPYRLLAYPTLAYIVVGPITPNLGSRYVGVMLALGLVAAGCRRDRPGEDEPSTSVPGRHAVKPL